MMAARKVRFAGVVRNALIAVLGLTLHPGCRSRGPEDLERALVKKRAELLAGSRRLIFSPMGSGHWFCPTPLLSIDGAGVTISLYPAGGIVGRDAAEGPPPPPSAEPSIWGQVVVPRAGVCPSVPRRNGHLDGELLFLLLRAVNASIPTCPPEPVPPAGESEDQRRHREFMAAGAWSWPSVTIAPGDGTTWQEIVEAFDAAADANLGNVGLIRLVDEQTPASCADAITLEVLRERLAGWKPEVEQ
jgi:hypothetical protein